MDQQIPESEQQPFVQELPKKRVKPALLVGLLVLILVPLILLAYNFFVSKQLGGNLSQTNRESQGALSLPKDGFFLDGVDTIPLEKITLENFPNTRDVKGAVLYRDHLWFSGDGSLVEFDPKTKEIVSYSDPKKANCDSNLVILSDYLYAACRSLGSEAEIDEVSGFPLYHIYKIYLPEHKVERIFKKKDGLKNQSNFQLASAGNDEVWIGTFEGVALFHPATERFVFYTKELEIAGSHFGINQVIADKDYIWAVVSANAESEGGLALFDRKTSTWTGFGPHELLENDQSRFDLEHTRNGPTVKLIEGRLRVAFRDGEDSRILVEKQYSYKDKTWTTLRTAPFDGDTYEAEYERLAAEYDAYASRGSLDSQEPLTQVTLDGKEYIINGRANLWLSPVINKKRYIVTGGSIDVLTEEIKLPRILIPFSQSIDNERLHTQNPMVKFLTTPDSDIALVFDPDAAAGFEGPDHYGTMKVWALDTRTDEILVEEETIDRFAWRIREDYKLVKDERSLVVVDSEGEPLFQFDAETKEFGILDDTIAR